MLAWLRSLLHLLFMAVSVIPWSLVAIAASPFVGPARMYRICMGWVALAMHSGSWMLGIRNRVTGMDNLPQDGRRGAVLLVKHQSTWETFVMPTILPRQLAFVFKRELVYVPFFGWAMARLDMVHIDRSQRAQAFRKVVDQGRRLLDQGIWVIMFPEGTRIPRGQAGKYKTSGVRLAIETGVPVIPVAVTSARCWPRKAFIKYPGVVDVSIGKPIASTGREPEEMMHEVQHWIESEMRRLDPEAYVGQAPLAPMRADQTSADAPIPSDPNTPRVESAAHTQA